MPLTPAEEIIYSSESADISEYVEMMDLHNLKTPLELSGANSQVKPDEETEGEQSTITGDTTGHSPRTASVSTADTEHQDDSENLLARLAMAEAL